MGMFDYVRCSYRLDDRVGSRDVFQTKDLDCCLDTYWIDPGGRMWRTDESNTYDIVEESAEDIFRARENREWLPPFRPVPNGQHGRVMPYPVTRAIRIVPSDWQSKVKDKLYHSDWPEYELVFREGKLILVQILR